MLVDIEFNLEMNLEVVIYIIEEEVFDEGFPVVWQMVVVRIQ